LASCYSEVVPVESLRIILANMKLHSYVCGEVWRLPIKLRSNLNTKEQGNIVNQSNQRGVHISPPLAPKAKWQNGNPANLAALTCA